MKPTVRKLNIAIVSDAIYPYNIGGKEKRIYEISTRLAKKGHKVTIYTMKWWKGKEAKIIHEGVIHEAISPLYPLYSGERRSIKEALMFALHTIKLVNKSFEILEVDHMPHLILFPIKLVTLIKRKKLYVTWNEVWGRKYWVEYLGLAGNLAYIVELLSVKTPDVIISVSEHTTQKLKEEFGISKNIKTIPNGINSKELSKIKPSKDKSDVIYAGRLLTHKNVDKLITTIAELKKTYPKIKCFIVGNGPEEKNLKNLAKKLKLETNVFFYGFQKKHSDLYTLVKASKTFVLPSSREGFGLAAIEANALGIPVITYDYKDNATKSLIKKGMNGYLFDDSKNKLSTSIKKTFTNSFNSKKIISTTSSYNWDHIANKIEESYLS